MSDVPTSRLHTEQIDRLDAALDGTGIGTGIGTGGAVGGEHGQPQLVGRYRVLERLGEGGMGAVYKAEQRAPIERIVALKLIRPGLDDAPEIVRRFTSERQALAWMDHPNIAKVLDAGADPVTGRPYFVMEYVPGLPITRYCDEQRLSNRQRLELFLQVCDAVAHAHQKMVVHRDLKPSNVLVRSANGEGGPSTAQVKVIDFGIAKALVSPTADRSTTVALFTDAGHVVGTLDYMSPEQARGAGTGPGAVEDVDTRADIYSLGVMLYELLTGALPFDPQRLRGGGLGAMERMICEVDPPRPSTRLSSLGEATGDIARRRQTEPHELARELRRELEWIPLKAMRKDRAERYATAAELADDVRNYLAGRPLRAAPESRLYRARKFLRRNRVAVAVASLVVLLLIGGIAGTSWQAVRAERQRRLAESRFDDIRNFASGLIFDIHGDVVKLAGSQPAVDKILAVALDYLQKLEAGSSDNFDVVRDAAIGYQRLGDLQGSQFGNNKGDPSAAYASYMKSRDLAERALSLRPGDERGRRVMGTAELKLGDAEIIRKDDKTALAHFLAGQQILDEIAVGKPEDYSARADAVRAAQRVAVARDAALETSDAVKVHEQTIALTRKLVSDFPQEEDAKLMLASALHRAYPLRLRGGDFDGALATVRECVSIRERLTQGHPDDVDRQVLLAASLQTLARVLGQREELDQALAAQERCVKVASDLYRKDPSNQRVQLVYANAQLLYGELAGNTGRFDDSQVAYDAAIATYRAMLERAGSNRDAFRMTLYALSSMGDMLAKRGDHGGALARHREAIVLLAQAVAAKPDEADLAGGLAFAQARVGKILIDTGDAAGAIEPLTRAVELTARLAAADPANALIAWNLVDARASLGDAHGACGAADAAADQYKQARDLAAALQRNNMRGANQTPVEILDAKLAALNTPATAPAAAPISQPATRPAAATR